MTSYRKLKTQTQSKKAQEEVRMRAAEQRVEGRGERLGGAGYEGEPYGLGKIKKYQEAIECMKSGGKTGVELVPFGTTHRTWGRAFNTRPSRGTARLESKSAALLGNSRPWDVSTGAPRV